MIVLRTFCQKQILCYTKVTLQGHGSIVRRKLRLETGSYRRLTTWLAGATRPETNNFEANF